MNPRAVVVNSEWVSETRRAHNPAAAAQRNTHRPSSTPGIEVSPLPFSSDTPVPADRWPAVLEVVHSIAVANGFEGIDLTGDEGLRRLVSMRDHQGGQILLGAGGRTALKITTGCYLR